MHVCLFDKDTCVLAAQGHLYPWSNNVWPTCASAQQRPACACSTRTHVLLHKNTFTFEPMSYWSTRAPMQKTSVHNNSTHPYRSSGHWTQHNTCPGKAMTCLHVKVEQPSGLKASCLKSWWIWYMCFLIVYEWGSITWLLVNCRPLGIQRNLKAAWNAGFKWIRRQRCVNCQRRRVQLDAKMVVHCHR